MGGQPDTQRLVGDLARFGTVASVDVDAATCRVRIGDIETGDIPWLTGRAGAARIWSPPSIGEQVLLICPEGDTAAAIALPGVYSNARPAPESGDASVSIHFEDGTRLGYDPASKALTVAIAESGTASIVATGGLAIRGDVTVEGSITASADVRAGEISLQNHRHDEVQVGTAISGKPVA